MYSLFFDMVLLHSTPIALGTPAPYFSLPGTDEQMYSLDSFSAEYLVVIFMCNHCPYIIEIDQRLRSLHKQYRDKGIDFVGISANDATQYPQDGFEEMQARGYAFPYLYDETQDVAKAYKAQCTPDIYVYNKKRELVYHGRFDDSLRGEVPCTTTDLQDALDDLLEKGEVSFEQVPSQGCSIKWKAS